ncbi:MAG: hypothetical protein K2H90_00045 [Oscillospiraceae bacterium]|nr:hypothetical protein [Oscillospiraceae bacterium]
MQKTIKIENVSFNLAATGAVLCLYKQQFGVEYYDDFLRITAINTNISATDTQKAALSLEIGYRLIWSMAKAADPSVSDPDVWIDEFEDFPLTELMPIAMELLGKSFEQVIMNGTAGGEKLTSENLIACCLSCGLNMQDVNSLSIGFLLNSINEYIRIKSGGKSKTGTKRKATQADFDRF